MTTVNITKPFSSYLDFENFVKLMQPDISYKISNFYFETIKIDIERNLEDDQIEYCWALNRNYYVSGSTGVIFPLRSANLVKTFKTLAGCKKSLLAQMDVWSHVWKKTEQHLTNRAPLIHLQTLVNENADDKNKMLDSYKAKIDNNIKFNNDRMEVFSKSYDEIISLFNSYGIKIVSIDRIYKSSNYQKETAGCSFEVFDDTEMIIDATMTVNKIRKNKIVINQFIRTVRDAVMNRTDDQIIWSVNQFTLEGKNKLTCSFYIKPKK